jgi:methyl-accepting chemotaxis protein
LQEVNTAVNQMDQVTQQNAAMVEEANAAGATLATEAGRLRELIGEFRLGDAAPQAPSMKPTSKVQALRRPTGVMTSSAPVASPARGMMGKLAQAFTGRGSATTATAASNDSWEEF